MKKILRITIKSLLSLLGLLLFLFILFYFLTSGSYEVALTVEQDPSVPHIEVNGTVFHAETYGNDSNEVVIALHGGPGNDHG